MRLNCLAALPLLLVACDDTGGASEPRDVPPADAGRQVRDGEAADVGADLRILDQGPLPDVGADAGEGPADFLPEVDGAPRDPRCGVVRDPGEQAPLDLEPRCRNGGPLRIRDIRDQRCPDYEPLPDRVPGGREVFLQEAVVTAVFENNFVVQDPEGGAWASMWVFNQPFLDVEQLRPGTRVRLRGEVIEFFTLTELVPQRPDGIEIIRQGDPPTPILVADPTRIADGGDLAEPLESALLELRDLQVAETAPDCPSDFGMFTATGDLRVGDEAEHGYEAKRGDVLPRLVGVLHFSFEHFKLYPRGPEDLESVWCGGVPDKCEAEECPVPIDEPESGALVVSELQINPRGDDRLAEYIEIYNASADPLDVDGWWLQDCAGHRAPLTGSIPARTYYVLAADLDRRENGGVDADADMGDLFLPNGFGSVLVFDEHAALVDQVRYAPGDDGWPRRRTGVAIELVELVADNRDGRNWSLARREYGPGGDGTPGRPYRN